jgi:hypothetical protein
VIEPTPEEEALVAMLLEAGALYIGGVDENGKDLYFMDPPVMKEVCPPFYDLWMRDLDDGLMELFKLGLLEVNYDESLKPRFSVRTTSIDED